MKKNNTASVLRNILCLLVMSLTVLTAQAKVQPTGDGNYNVEFNNLPLRSVFNEFEKAGNLRFFMQGDLPELDRAITYSATNKSFGEVMQGILRNLEYQMVENNLVLIRAKESQSTSDSRRRVEGKVADASGVPFVGMTVFEKGTMNAAVTGADGSYSIPVRENSTLVYSYVGYLPLEFAVGNRSRIDVTMQEDVGELEQVVVIGYGTAKKKDLTGSVGSINQTQIAKQTSSDASAALQGQIAGVNVAQTNRRPGDGYSIQVRGFNTITTSDLAKNSEPLIVIDGVIGADITMVNPADIEQIDVLKDASATAIYGSRGTNGVVIISTKSGKQGKNTVTYNGSVGIRVPTNLPRMMTGPEFVEAYEAAGGDGSGNKRPFSAREKEKIAAGDYTDWPDFILKNGMQTNHNVSMAGGTANESHFFSAGYVRETGNIRKQDYERYNLKASVDGNLKHGFSAGASAYFAYSVQNEGGNEALRSAYRIRPTGDIYDAEGNLQFMPTSSDDQCPNPWFETENRIVENRTINFLGNLFVAWKAAEGLELRTTFSPSVRSFRKGTSAGTFTKENAGTAPPTAKLENAHFVSYTWDNMVNYDKTIGKHRFGATGVYSLLSDRREGSNITAKELANDSQWYLLEASDNIESVTSWFSEYNMISFMGRVNYSYDDRYLATATIRRDGNSKLAKGHKWASFPSVALAWRASQEHFLRDVKWVSNLKLRVGFGMTGNDVVEPYSTQSLVGRTAYDWNGEAANGFAPATLSNELLGWEKASEFNAGLDFGFFNSRVSGTFDWYHRLTTDLILRRQLPSHTGYAWLYYNSGKVMNRGFEVSLNTVNVQTKDFRWTTNLNFAKNHNEILEVYGDHSNDRANNLFIHQSAKVIYTYQFDGIWQESEIEEAKIYKKTPGNIRVKDLDDVKGITENDRTFIGDGLPKWTGGITNTFQYKNLDLSFFIYTRQGEMASSMFYTHYLHFDRRYNKLNYHYWTPENPSNTYPRIGGTADEYVNLLSYADLSFVRVGHISLGYNFSQHMLKRMGIDRLRFYATVNNPWVCTDYMGFDPEGFQGTADIGVSVTTWLFGVNLTF